MSSGGGVGCQAFLVDKKIVGESGYDDGRGMDATDHGVGKTHQRFVGRYF